MSFTYYFLIMIFGVLGLGIFVLILFSHIKNSKTISSTTNKNVEARVLPFVEIHQSLLLDAGQEASTQSNEELRKKIEGFKNRNRFYQS